MDDTYNNSTVLLESSFMEVREAAKISYFLDVRTIFLAKYCNKPVKTNKL